MIDKLILGRYVPGDSFLHRLDPRAKLVMGLLYIGILFW
ncbi:Energy-coupling factor transporter transmembrane protein EcfT [Listeria grayi]|uniref:Energy-coupling factor transporter transmembrane protein EcfT n=1 Tax=Listeria grayi TaxID=1641 RepID=A0A378MDY5_LISGR|nr:Energy-coupling factor transporter transmembrane protein EcfT [Listeria grayi]